MLPADAIEGKLSPYLRFASVQQDESRAQPQHPKRNPGFSLVGIQERFQFRPGWYREGAVRGLVLAYYFVLRRAVRSRPHLQPCLARCRHCRIFFLAHPRNRGRKDLGCPFGCRDAHRRSRSAARSKAYYGTAAGKQKKARLNGRRRQAPHCAGEPAGESADPESTEVEFDAGIVAHVRVVTSLIEGFDVSRDEVLAMLERTVRQRRIVRQRRLDYVLRWLAEHFP